MSVKIRIRNELKKNLAGEGGANEGYIRGASSDLIENTGGVVNLSGGHCLVHENDTPDMSVIVDDGVVYIPNVNFDEADIDQVKFWEGVVISEALVIDSNSSGSTRIDLICIKMDTAIIPDEYASNIASLVVVKGTPGAGAPATPDNHYKLAEVEVVNGETAIEDASITDSRSQIRIKSAFGGGGGGEVSHTPVGAGTTDLDMSVASLHKVTMPAANQTLTVSNEAEVKYFTVEIVNTTGQGVLTWFSTINWAGGSPPILTNSNGKKDVFGFRVTGTDTYDGYIIGQNV